MIDFLFYKDSLAAFASVIRGDFNGRINLVDACSRLGIDIRPDFRHGREATLSRSSDGKYIITFCSKTEEFLFSKRDRFSIAHELGHYYLIEAHGLNIQPNDVSSYHKVEALCNEFAGELLVDSRVIRGRSFDSVPALFELLMTIESEFGVSKEVAARRLAVNKSGWVAAQIKMKGNPKVFKWIIASEGVNHYHGKYVHLGDDISPFNFIQSWIRKKYGEQLWSADLVETFDWTLIGAIKKAPSSS